MQRGLAAFPTPKNPSAPKNQGLSDSRTSVTPSQTRNTPKFSNTKREKALTLGKDQFQLETFHLETSKPEFPTSCCPRTAQKMQVHDHSQNSRLPTPSKASPPAQGGSRVPHPGLSQHHGHSHTHKLPHTRLRPKNCSTPPQNDFAKRILTELDTHGTSTPSSELFQ